MDNTKDISILIPTLKDRASFLQGLLTELNNQIAVNNAFGKVKIIIDDSDRPTTIGEKRNNLLKKVDTEYCCFFDDDDMPSVHYISTLLEGVKDSPDLISLRGIMTTNGRNPEVFEHSLKYSAYRTTKNEIKYERYPNHLNCMKSSIAKSFSFINKNWGEDTDWATEINRSGVLKNEFYTDKVLYNYLYRSNK